ncbi:MAG: T9SS type A sorting domain-containing protein [Ignavibacteriales bacterium]|nr:T9SS type A sorting domain-containing protein [Ignavibacteriales bacterium]
MKTKIILILFVSCLYSISAQNITYKRLDINNIHLYLQNIGNLKYVDGVGGGYWNSLPSVERWDSVIVFDQGPWVIGKIKNKVYVGMVQWWDVPSSIFSPGPIINNKPAMYTAPQDSMRYRCYKISRGDNASNPDYSNWPVDFGAPVNSNGSPKLYGDQTIWTVYNALDSTRSYREYWNTHLDSLPVMPVEIQQTVFARKGNLNDEADIFSNIVFEEWTIINKGNETIDSTYFSLWTDIDLWLNSAYNIPQVDTSLGLGYLWSNNSQTPQLTAGYALLYGPSVSSNGDRAVYKGRLKNNFKNLDMSSFHSIFGDAAVGNLGEPAFTRQKAWNIARGYYPDGTVKIDSTTGKKTKYTFSGDPVTNSGWIRKEYTGGGAGFNMFSGPFTLAPNDTQWVMVALVPALGKDYKESITRLRKKVALLKSLPYDSLAFGKTPLVVDVKENQGVIPNSFMLYQNYPNPFNPSTTIKYSIPHIGTGHVVPAQLKVYDVLGREVAILVNEEKSPGNYEVKFDGTNISSGVYFYTLSANGFFQSKKMLLMK